jgi:hypothetical protein
MQSLDTRNSKFQDTVDRLLPLFLDARVLFALKIKHQNASAMLFLLKVKTDLLLVYIAANLSHALAQNRLGRSTTCPDFPCTR